MKYKTIPYAPYIIKESEPKNEKSTLSDADLQYLEEDLSVHSAIEKKHFGDSDNL